MRKYLYLAIAAICLGLSACGGDDEELASVNTGEENTTDFAVTGSVQEVYLEEDDNRNVTISADIIGYLNLTDELRLAVGMAPIFGVEVSTNLSFPERETQQFATQRMDDNRKFTITATDLKENTTYYYRTFLTNTIFGETKTFTTESYEAVAAKMTIPTADARWIGNNSASISISDKNTGIAYATDKSLLTAANVKAAVKSETHPYNGIQVSTNGNLEELASGTTYYYCEYRGFGTSFASSEKYAYRTTWEYVAFGEIKSFTTEGYKAEDLAKQMSINASLNTNTQMWKVNIQSSLSLPGKTIKYGVTHKMTSNYDDDVKATWMYRYTGDDWETNSDVIKLYSSYYRGKTLYGAVVFDNTVYAEGSNNSYQASIENPYYNGIYDDESIENWWYYCKDEFGSWFELDVFFFLKAKVKNGVAVDSEIEEYEDLLYHYESTINNLSYASYAKCYLQVFVEIDGVRYVVKEQEGKLRVPTPEDNPIDSNYDSNNKNDDDEEEDFGSDAQA